MTTTQQTERDRIAAQIAKLRTEQRRLPVHFVEKRKLLGKEIDSLVREWLDTDA